MHTASGKLKGNKEGNGLGMQNVVGHSPPLFWCQGGTARPSSSIMKASVKLRDHEGQVQKQPIVKAKLPFDFLGFPVHAAFKVCGHIEELALRFSSAHQEAGPSVEVSYHPHQQDCPFTLSLKTGFSPWPSSPASAFTIAAEFNLSRPSNPTFLLRVKPQLGDFSFRHDFRSQICGGSSALASKNEDHRHAMDVASSGMSFTNAFARYASKLHLSDNATSPWHDSAKSFETGQNLRYNAASNANLASFDSTPYESERASLARFDLANRSLEHPSQFFMEEKRSFPDVNQHTSIVGADWVPLRDNTSCQKAAATHLMSRMDEEWERVGDAISRSTTSASSSTQKNRDSDHTHARRRSGVSRSTSSLAGWTAGGFSGCTHLWACTRLPISPEAHLKIRWSVSAYSSASSKVPFLPLLLLDKVSLEATAPCTGFQKAPIVLPFSNTPRNEAQAENVKQAGGSSSKKAREESISDSGPDVAGLEMELKPVQQRRSNNGNAKKTSFFGQFLQVRGQHG